MYLTLCYYPIYLLGIMYFFLMSLVLPFNSSFSAPSLFPDLLTLTFVPYQYLLSEQFWHQSPLLQSKLDCNSKAPFGLNSSLKTCHRAYSKGRKRSINSPNTRNKRKLILNKDKPIGLLWYGDINMNYVVGVEGVVSDLKTVTTPLIPISIYIKSIHIQCV